MSLLDYLLGALREAQKRELFPKHHHFRHIHHVRPGWTFRAFPPQRWRRWEEHARRLLALGLNLNLRGLGGDFPTSEHTPIYGLALNVI